MIHTMSNERQLWLLRHGATEWANNGRHTGNTDLPLLPEGEEEAQQLAPALNTHQFATVFSSPLQRAKRTCELSGLGQQRRILESLREWNYGDYEGMTTPEIRKKFRTGQCGAMAAPMEKMRKPCNNAANKPLQSL